jgi:gliding motility-associated-like protein
VDGPTAKFGLVSTGVCLNKETTFRDSTLADGRNAIQSWDWNFGDGHSQIFTAPPFTHVYDSTNNYFVSLKVTDVRGCADSFTMIKTVKPVIISSRFGFTAYPNSDSLLGCINSPFSFVCPFAETGFTYKWDLGDNTYSTMQYASKRYQTGGTYNIKLVVSNNAGCSDSTIRYNMVKIVEPIAKFSINDSFKTCPPLVVNFTDSSTYAISKTWSFGDSTVTTTNNPSHFYSYPGTYFAKLTVVGPGGCTAEAVKRIVVNGPRGTINYNATSSCKPYLFNFNVQSTDAVQYTWDFNDGNTVTNSLTSMVHTYENAGKYIPKLMLVDGEGCRVAISSRDTILASFVDADFSQQVQNSCDTGSVRFLNITQTNDRIASYKWLFGDGTSSVLKDADHKFAQDGIYNAKLIVTTATGCSDTATKSITIKRVAPPQFQIISIASGCVPLALGLQAQLTSTDTNTVTWKWKFPNGDSSSLQNPPAQLFNNAGSYTIRLSATNSIGCTKEISKAIQTFASPIVNAGQDIELCEGATAQLNASGAITYEWIGQNLSCLNCPNPTVSAVGDSKYIVKGTNVNGCFAKDSVLVKINKKAHVVVDSVANTCKGLSKQLQATGSSNYQWTPSIGLSNTTIANPIINIIATTSYRVIGTNNNACGADTAYLLVRVNENPTVNAGEDKIISAGSSVDLDPVYSSDVISFSWTPTGELFRAGSNAITVRPTENTEYTASVENRFGCKAQDKVKVTVACQKANVFIPNLFSPNGDNVNDVFFVRGIGLQKVRSIRIFNRWGQIVFSKNNFNANDATEGWDGRYKGKLLSTDTYIYMAEVVCGNGTVFSLNGNISLVD